MASIGALAYAVPRGQRLQLRPGDLSRGPGHPRRRPCCATGSFGSSWKRIRILIRQGFLKKTALDLPFDRVQGINVERSVIDRLLGLVTDQPGHRRVGRGRGATVAGGWDRVAPIGLAHEGGQPAACGWSVVQRRKTQGGRGSADQTGARGRARVSQRLAGPRSLTRSRRASLGHRPAQAHRRRHVPHRSRQPQRPGGRAAALGRLRGGTIGFVAEEAIVSRSSTRQRGHLWPVSEQSRRVRSSVALLALLGPSWCWAWWLVIAGAFLRHHDYHAVARGEQRTATRGGLLTQKEVVVESAKIQHLTLSQSVVLRWFGRYRLRAHPVMRFCQRPARGRDRALNLRRRARSPLARVLRLAERLAFAGCSAGEGTALTMLPREHERSSASRRYYRRALALRDRHRARCSSGPPFFSSGCWGPRSSWGMAPPASGGIAWAMTLDRTHLRGNSGAGSGYMHDDDGLASRSGLDRSQSGRVSLPQGPRV